MVDSVWYTPSVVWSEYGSLVLVAGVLSLGFLHLQEGLLSWSLLAHGPSQSTPHDDFCMCLSHGRALNHPSPGWEGELGWVFFHLNGLLCFPQEVRAQTIHQWPSTRVQPAGSLLSLECTVKGTSNPTLYWYRQEAESLQLLFSSVGVDQIEPREFRTSKLPGPRTASSP